MSRETKNFGKLAEKEAVRFLKKWRYRIVERNYTCPFGEIDIIALDGRTLVFIEVKARRSLEGGYPEDAVTQRKQAQIAHAAIHFREKKKVHNVPGRFDVLSLHYDDDTKRWSINHIKDAFGLDDCLPSKYCL